MKSFDSRTYSVNDFVEWDNNRQLILNPRFQRRSVWTDNARSYLMDTIIRGKPMPKVFIRQRINVTTKASVREVVDGQQRLRTILSYIKDGFQVNKRHNHTFGGRYFSQLSEIDDEIQASILNYEIAVDLLVNIPDPEILDIFSRLNSYAINLNPQERINADHFSPFKTLADDVGHKYAEYFTTSKILSDAEVLRMGDVTLVADLLIAMIEGIKSKKQLRAYYDQYEKQFDHDVEELSRHFDDTMVFIDNVFGESLRQSAFRRIHLFYSLFTAVYHLLFGLPVLDADRREVTATEYPRIRSRLESVDTILDVDDPANLSAPDRRFLEDSRRATTDTAVRVRRTRFVLDRALNG
jgi:hypothetical protein